MMLGASGSKAQAWSSRAAMRYSSWPVMLSEFQVVSKTTACAAGATARAPLQWADCEHDAASSCTGAGLGAAGLVAWLVPANQAPDHVSYYLIAPGGSAGPSW